MGGRGYQRGGGPEGSCWGRWGQEKGGRGVGVPGGGSQGPDWQLGQLGGQMGTARARWGGALGARWWGVGTQDTRQRMGSRQGWGSSQG